jgi:hypothetical protein
MDAHERSRKAAALVELRAIAAGRQRSRRDALREFDERVDKLRQSAAVIEPDEEDELRGLRERILAGSWWGRMRRGGAPRARGGK